MQIASSKACEALVTATLHILCCIITYTHPDLNVSKAAGTLSRIITWRQAKCVLGMRGLESLKVDNEFRNRLRKIARRKKE